MQDHAAELLGLHAGLLADLLGDLRQLRGGPAEDAESFLLERAVAALDPDRVRHLRHRAPHHRADLGLVARHHTAAPAPSPISTQVVRSVQSVQSLSFSTPMTSAFDAAPARIGVVGGRERVGEAGAGGVQVDRGRACRGRAGPRPGRRCSVTGRSPYRSRRRRSRSRGCRSRRWRRPSSAARRPSRRPARRVPRCRRSRIPTRLWIHSSLVSTMVASSALVSTRSGW